MYTRNINGPRMEPCGTPVDRTLEGTPSFSTYWLYPVRQLVNVSRGDSVIDPIMSTFLN